jgi:hypothetical protein
MSDIKETNTTILHRVKDEIAIEWHFTGWATVPSKFTHRMWPLVCEKYATENIKALQSDLSLLRQERDKAEAAWKVAQSNSEHYQKEVDKLKEERDKLKEKLSGFDSMLDTMNDQAKREFDDLKEKNQILTGKLKGAEDYAKLANEEIKLLKEENRNKPETPFV